MIVVQNEEEALEAYAWLLESDSERQKVGEHARERIFKDHTYHNRAELVSEKLAKCYRHTKLAKIAVTPQTTGKTRVDLYE